MVDPKSFAVTMISEDEDNFTIQFKYDANVDVNISLYVVIYYYVYY